MYGQSFGGRIVGLVTDSSAAALSNASVTVVNEGTGAQRQLLTDASGSYVAAELPVGYYTLRFEAPGMGRLERQKVKVDVGSEARADVVLTVEAMQQSIDVTAQAPVLQQGSSSLTEVVETRRVEDLPLNGRDFRKLAFLVPGAAPRSTRGSLGSFTVNGQREKSNIFLIDGVDNNDPFRNQASFNQGGVGGAQATLFPIDALAEFSVQSQGSAEYGRNSGAVVNAVIKSGTNQLHGTLYEFLRNDKLNARNFFETLPGATKGPFKNSNYGGTVGGPIQAQPHLLLRRLRRRTRTAQFVAGRERTWRRGHCSRTGVECRRRTAGECLGREDSQSVSAGKHTRSQGELCLQPSESHQQRQFRGEDRSPVQ